jgi:hypothetical protein
MENFATLTCPSCGGKLQIGNDVERFACGFCGNEHVVKRGGGIVSLTPVIAEIRNVQIGVDKTASELALVRLTNEIDSIKKLDKKIGKTLDKYDITNKYALNKIHYFSGRLANAIKDVLINFDNKTPSRILSIWQTVGYIFFAGIDDSGNLTGFSDHEISSRLYSLKEEEILPLVHIIERQNPFYNFNGTPNQGSEKVGADEVGMIRFREDLLEIKEMYEIMGTLPAKLEELKKHQQIVSR